MARNLNYSDIVRVATGMDIEQRTQFAGILEVIAESDRQALALIELGLNNGTVGVGLNQDAIEVLKWMAARERTIRFR